MGHTGGNHGNREFDAANTTTLGSCTQAVCNPAISTATNRISESGYAYDQTGNVAQDAEGKRFAYDAENHQTKFFAAGNNSSTPDATYSYDGDGRRIKKVTATETTVFVYNASGQLVAEYSTQISQTPQVSYLTQDHLGSPRVVTDQLGAVKERKDYSAFGEETISPQRNGSLGYATADEVRKGYTGYEKDKESGLDFAQARYYNSTHGRFTSVDPLTASADIRNPQTFNRYSYVLNSPYKYTDPLGLMALDAACGGSCPGSFMGIEGDGYFSSKHGDVWKKQQAEEVESPPELSVQNDGSTIDAALTGLLTDTGDVIGASSPHLKDFETGEVMDNHTQFANGVVHTVHIVGVDAGVYVPKGFTEVLMVPSTDTVVIRNPATREVLMIAHVQIGAGRKAEKLVKENMKTVRENGSLYIGKTGGRGGEGSPAVGAGKASPPHAHLQYHSNESNRIKAWNKIKEIRKIYGSSADFTQKDFSPYVSDFRNLVK